MNKNEISKFKVYDGKNLVGTARLVNDKAKVTIDIDGKKLLAFADDTYLKEFSRIAKKLCESVGHYSRFSIRQDLDSGIEVSRVLSQK